MAVFLFDCWPNRSANGHKQRSPLLMPCPANGENGQHDQQRPLDTSTYIYISTFWKWVDGPSRARCIKGLLLLPKRPFLSTFGRRQKSINLAIDSYSLYKGRLAPKEWSSTKRGFSTDQRLLHHVTIYGRVLRYTQREKSFWQKISNNNKNMRTLKHRPVGRIGNGKDVRRHFVSFFALVQIDYLLSVDGQSLVRVDYHAKQSRVCLQNNK